MYKFYQKTLKLFYQLTKVQISISCPDLNQSPDLFISLLCHIVLRPCLKVWSKKGEDSSTFIIGLRRCCSRENLGSGTVSIIAFYRLCYWVKIILKPMRILFLSLHNNNFCCCSTCFIFFVSGVACEPGSYCPEGSSFPQSCDAGYYCPSERIECPAGKNLTLINVCQKSVINHRKAPSRFFFFFS